MITFKNVTKKLGGKTILDDVSFEVPKGETFVVVGLSPGTAYIELHASSS